jgi:hypothetical protein
MIDKLEEIRRKILLKALSQHLLGNTEENIIQYMYSGRDCKESSPEYMETNLFSNLRYYRHYNSITTDYENGRLR